ncbi:MAG: hypothetical protein B0A82_03555 [Alkalinema sp. CACIAM 70d]|nr:MAG: hypothetical protein B0A82_03555 [Alkalinema sp. CACIAM 70d]
MTCVLDMRKTKTFRLEEKLLAALDELAEKSGRTPNAYLEELLFRHCQAQGVLSLSEEPPKNQRGGKRPGAGRRKTKKTDEQPDTEA